MILHYRTLFLEDCVATVSETVHVFLSVMNLTCNHQRNRGSTQLGTVVPVYLVYRAVPQQLIDSNPKTEVNKDRVDFVYEVYEIQTSAPSPNSLLRRNLSFYLQRIPGSSDPTEEGLADREKRKRFDPELMAFIPGPESQLPEVNITTPIGEKR